MIRTKSLFLASLAALGLLAACDGYEMVRIEGMNPYTEERTAGVGVAYVRAHLLPEKGPVLAAETPPPLLPSAYQPVYTDAEPLFTARQSKGK